MRDRLEQDTGQSHKTLFFKKRDRMEENIFRTVPFFC